MKGSKVKLVYDDNVYGVIEVEETIYEVDKTVEAKSLYGTT